MLCRKLIMHVAVEKGAAKNQTFKAYVDHLVKTHILSKECEEFAHHVRDLGNDANHELDATSPEEAKEMIDFLTMLCLSVYVYPSKFAKLKKGSEL